MSNNSNSSSKAYPGKFIGYVYDYSIGDQGVYVKDDKLFSSIAGDIIIDSSFKPPKISVKNNLSNIRPKISDEVYFKVTKVMKTSVIGDIIALKTQPLKIPITAMLKSENIKSDFRDFDVFDCFTPGDIVLARVISIDQTSYIYLSTQDTHLGVVFARSPLTNNLMMPISYEKMMCMDTNVQYSRKVAKPSFM